MVFLLCSLAEIWAGVYLTSDVSHLVSRIARHWPADIAFVVIQCISLISNPSAPVQLGSTSITCAIARFSSWSDAQLAPAAAAVVSRNRRRSSLHKSDFPHFNTTTTNPQLPRPIATRSPTSSRSTAPVQLIHHHNITTSAFARRISIFIHTPVYPSVA